VAPETLVALGSTASAVKGLVALAEASTDALGGRTAFNLPALTVSVNEMLDALEAVAGKSARALVRFEPDAAIMRIVSTWPPVIDSARAQRLGLTADPDFISIVRAYMSDCADSLRATSAAAL
jgi:nucleoside-diphosphate-sugar epimerase